ncbi:UROD/MetE-like protein [Auriculariales sp. MPI-PUGE-AT-0066]|nr:UROD/MetE-like protein [Auriculariales sp. MPI-PUGE-AT-0066]
MANMYLKLRPPFRAEHIGSLKRPDYLLAARAAVEKGTANRAELRAEEDKAIKAVVELQRKAGIKGLTDGEFRRRMFFDGFFDNLGGISFDPELSLDKFMEYVPVTRTYRLLGYKGLPSYLCTGKITRTQPLYLAQFEALKGFVKPEVHSMETIQRDLIPSSQEIPNLKLTVCAPEYFHLRHGEYAYPKSVYKTDDAYFADIVTAYRAEIADLYAAGLRNLQFDDPSLAYFCDISMINGMKAAGIDPEALFDRYLRLYNDIIDGNFKGSVHFAEGSYDAIAIKLFNVLNMDCFYLEYDNERAGSFEPLKHIPRHKVVVLGLVSSKVPQLESIDDIKKRVHQAANLIANGTEKRSEAEALNQICISPQCGFASHFEGNQITDEDMFKKLQRVSQAAQEIWEDERSI